MTHSKLVGEPERRRVAEVDRRAGATELLVSTSYLCGRSTKERPALNSKGQPGTGRKSESDLVHILFKIVHAKCLRLSPL